MAEVPVNAPTWPPMLGEQATCLCGRTIRYSGSLWAHADDDSTLCYPESDRGDERKWVAEPDLHAEVPDA